MTVPTAPTPHASAHRPAGGRPQQPRKHGPRALDPVRVLRQNLKWLVLAVVVGGFIGVGAFVVLDRFFPLYGGRVVFEINPQVDDPNDPTSQGDETDEVIRRLAQTETSRLTREQLLEKAVQRPDIRQTTWHRQFLDDSGNLIVDEAVLDLVDDLRAFYQRDTRYFILSWRTGERDDVTKVLNTVARVYEEDRQAQVNANFEAQLRVFQNQRSDLDNRIASLRRTIDAFIRENPDITGTSDQFGNELREKVTELSREIQERKSDQDSVTSALQQTRMKLAAQLEPSDDDIREAEQEPVILGLIDQIANLSVRYQSARERLNIDHPTVRRLEELLESARSQKEEEVRQTIQRNLGSRVKALTDQAEILDSNLERLSSDLSEAETRLQERTARLKELQDQVSEQEKLEAQKESVDETILKIQAAKAFEMSKIAEIASFAEPPREKAFPDLKLVVPASVALFLFGTLGFVFVRELLDPHVKYPSDLAAMPGVRILGVLPDLRDDPTGARTAEMVVRNEPDSVLAESYRQFTAQVGKAMRTAQCRSLLVMSGMPESGSTTIVTNLALSAAAAGRKVIVVDANFRRPGMTDAMGVTCERGLGDVLAGDCEVDDAIVSAGDGVDVLGVGSEMNRVFERLDTDGMSNLLERLKARYDFVIVDAPPGVVAGDALVLASRADAALLVVRADAEERGLIGRLVGQLNHMEVRFLGVVLNRPRHAAGGYFRKNFRTMAGYGASRS